MTAQREELDESYITKNNTIINTYMYVDTGKDYSSLMKKRDFFFHFRLVFSGLSGRVQEDLCFSIECI